MPNMNKVMIMGHLGRDPETRTMGNGDAVANFTVAVTEKWKDGEHTEWFRCVAFGKLAEIIAQYLKKGDPAFFEGSLRTRKWTDKDGAERVTPELRVHNVQLLRGRSAESPAAQPSSESVEGIDEDIPF